MIAFRLREYGSDTWTEIRVINADFDLEEEEETAAVVEQSLPLLPGYHIQRLSEIGQWEDLT